MTLQCLLQFMATLESINRSISNSKSTSSPASIVEIAIPENEDMDAQHQCASYSITEPTISASIAPLHLQDSDSPLNHNVSPRKSAKKSPKKSAKYYKNLMNTPSSSNSKSRPNIEIHAKRRYQLDDGRCGICQFIGQTSFAKGIWVGIVVESGADGNTNGTVYGKKYFQCRDGKGLFVRPDKIIQALGSTYSVTRARAKSAKNRLSQNNNKLHNKSTSADTAMLSMSTSSPINIQNGDVVDYDIIPKNKSHIARSKSSLLSKKNKTIGHKRKTHLSHPDNVQPKKVPQVVKFKKSKSFQPSDTRTRSQSTIKKEIKNTKQNKISRRKTYDEDVDRTPSPNTASNLDAEQYLDIIAPLTPALESIASKSADNSPYLTPISSEPLFADLSLPPLSPADSNGSSDLENDGVVLDTFSVLRAYFGDQDALSDDGGYSLRDKLWESSDDDSSEGARSDSMLDDEDWVNRQHRARQASLAQSLADALTIPALHSVQKKMGVYIGSKEKWKPPKYHILPDHSNPLSEKLLHHKKHLDQNYKNKKRIRKLGPIEIGKTKGYKMPKYDTVSTPESKRKLSFLDQDKGWYHKPSKVKNLSSPTIPGKKRSKTPKISKMTTGKKRTFEEEDEKKKKSSVAAPSMNFTHSTPAKKINAKTTVMSTLKKTEHQRSMSELPKKKKKKKNKKKKTKVVKKLSKTQAEEEWFESELTWVKRTVTNKRNGDKGTKGKTNNKLTRNSIKAKKIKNNKRKKKRDRNKPQTISLPSGAILAHKSSNTKTKKSTPQSAKSYASSCSRSTADSISPFPLTNFQKKTMKNAEIIINEMNENRANLVTPMEDYLTMSIIDDDEEDEKDNIAIVADIPYKMGLNVNDEEINTTGRSVGALFRTDAVIFEDSDLDSTKKRQTTTTTVALKDAPPKPISNKKKNKKKGKASKKNKKSVSLFSGSSNQIQKEKQQKTAMNKVKQMNSAKKIVQNAKVKKKKNTKNANKNSKIKRKGKKKKNKIFHKPNLRNPTYG